MTLLKRPFNRIRCTEFIAQQKLNLFSYHQEQDRHSFNGHWRLASQLVLLISQRDQAFNNQKILTEYFHQGGTPAKCRYHKHILKCSTRCAALRQRHQLTTPYNLVVSPIVLTASQQHVPAWLSRKAKVGKKVEQAALPLQNNTHGYFKLLSIIHAQKTIDGFTF